MEHHRSFREHLNALAQQGHPPQFVACVLPPLVEFDRIFADMGVHSFDVNKYLPADATAETYYLTSEIVPVDGGEPEVLESQWNAVWPGHDPIDGFAGDAGSVFTQTSGNVPLPDGPRTRALLLLVTTDFVHLSASRAAAPPQVRGAVTGPGDGYDYVELARPVPA